MRRLFVSKNKEKDGANDFISSEIKIERDAEVCGKIRLFVKNGMEGYDREVRMFLKWWPC